MDDYLITSHSFRPRTAERFFQDHQHSYNLRVDKMGGEDYGFFMLCPSLTVLIPSCKKHKESTDLLCKELDRQGLCFIVDSREDVDLGTKRQDLYKQCESVYSVQWDADDWISGDFSLVLHKYLEHADVDCINFLEHVIMGNETTITRRSMHFPYHGIKMGGQYCFASTPKSIIRTELARKVEFEKGKTGEDLAFARDLRPLLKSEINLEYIGYYYEYCSKGSATGSQEHQVRKD